VMRNLSLSELEMPLRGHLVGGDVSFSTVSTDSRHIRGGELFVALAGERFDAHDFIADVERAGAGAALLSRDVDVGLPHLRVADTEQALGRLGAFNRAQFQGPLVGITGSSGKTTVKNLVAAVLSQRGETLATEGNLNNEIGVPLTLLRIAPSTRFAVVEMGAGKPGDIAWLTELGSPPVAMVLNVMPAHLEGMGSVEAIADTKGAIYDQLGAAGTAIINRDEPWADHWIRRAGQARVIDFGVENAAAVTASNIVLRGAQGLSFDALTPRGSLSVTLALPGKHNVANALAAIAVGLACELTLQEIGDGLASVEPVPGRLSVQVGRAGVQVIDDCYNANPGSVKAAIDLLAACPGRRVLLLGAMRELGPGGEELHREVGTYAAERGVDALWGVGDELLATVEAFGRDGRWFENREQAGNAITELCDSETTVLVKGSRGARMEQLLPALLGPEGGASC